MGLLKNIGKIIKNTSVVGLLGKPAERAAREAKRTARDIQEEAKTVKADLDRKTQKERVKAQKLSMRGLRSRRAASYFTPGVNTEEKAGKIGG